VVERSVIDRLFGAKLWPVQHLGKKQAVSTGSSTNGENSIEFFGARQAAAWWRACEAARVVGMLAGLPHCECQ
jgi:hypothetical protein